MMGTSLRVALIRGDRVMPSRSSFIAALRCGARPHSWTSSSLPSLSICSSSSVVGHHQRRNYMHDIPDTLLPPGAVTSRFQSTDNPTARRRIVAEYALSPLFGSRVEACVLGSPLDVAAFRRHVRPKLRAAVAATLGLKEADVDISTTRHGIRQWEAVDLALLEPASSCRPTTLPRADMSSARSLVSVYFLRDDWDEFTCIEKGFELVDRIISNNAPELAKLNIGFADVPPHEVAEPINTLFGKDVTVKDHMDVAERWERRLERGTDAASAAAQETPASPRSPSDAATTEQK